MARTQSRKAANLTLDAALLTEARQLDINISAAAEDGVRRAVLSAKAEAWKRENAEAINDYNSWIDDNGLPLDKHRIF